MFVVIRYGADEEKIVNPNVLSSVLLSHIRKSCGFESVTEAIDLASESGEVIDLASKGKEYAKKYLEPRTTYIPVKIIGGISSISSIKYQQSCAFALDENEENPQTYIPLLDNASSEKMKFFVSNTTFRARAAKLKGGKEGGIKADDSTSGTGNGPKSGKQTDQEKPGQKDEVTKKAAAGAAKNGQSKAKK